MAQSQPINAPAILVVEDEPFIRMYLVDMIESEGFKVYEAANADEAIATMEAHPDIRVLFTDIDMPGSMDGVKLSHYVRRRWPPVRIFVASGRTCPAAEDMPLSSIFLRKPYSPNDLQQIFDAATGAELT